MIIPDILIYPLAILGIIYNLIEKKFFSALLGGIIGGSVLGIIAIFSWLILKKEAMGWGDVKFSSGLGLFLGWERLIYALIFAFIIGGVIAFILLITRIKKRGDYIPFGPFLSAGGTLSVLLNFPQNFFIL
jgi:leader peptidase (prepilin peptidase)/N-methyltransferase